MKTTQLYINKTPSKLLYISKIILGVFLITFFALLFFKDIYIDFWTVIGPLLGLALIINGLTGSIIKEINLETKSKSIVIIRESLFRSKTRYIKVHHFGTDIKTTNGKKMSIIPKFKLVLLDQEKEIDELRSGFLSINNEKIKQLYRDLRSIVKITNASGVKKQSKRWKRV